jgi:sugar lactone lactonase YvrE
MLLLALGTGCHRGSDPNATGTPPTISTQPVDASTVSGRPVTFTVGANGAAVLAYQWAKDGTNILGALSATYTLYNPQPTDAGHYSVTVTNDIGTVTSHAAILTVVPTPEFSAAVSAVFDPAGNLYVSDRDDHVIWKVSPTKQVALLAGTQGLAGSLDGQGSSASFRNPGCMAFDPAGNLVVADTGNHTIRRIAAGGTVTTLAGSPGSAGSTDAVGALARFNAPYGIAVDASGGIYIADSRNHTIRFLAQDGTVTTYAGTPQVPGQTNGIASSAQFNQPNALALAPDGTLYVADFGNSALRMISPSRQVSTLAGQAGTPGYFDATGTAALFRQPVGIALDASGNLWVADTHNHAIRSVTSAGIVHLVAGSGAAGNADGTGGAALFNLPCGITRIPSGSQAGNLLVADTYNHILRIVTPAGVVTTL